MPLVRYVVCLHFLNSSVMFLGVLSQLEHIIMPLGLHKSQEHKTLN